MNRVKKNIIISMLISITIAHPVVAMSRWSYLTSWLSHQWEQQSVSQKAMIYGLTFAAAGLAAGMLLNKYIYSTPVKKSRQSDIAPTIATNRPLLPASPSAENSSLSTASTSTFQSVQSNTNSMAAVSLGISAQDREQSSQKPPIDKSIGSTMSKSDKEEGIKKLTALFEQDLQWLLEKENLYIDSQGINISTIRGGAAISRMTTVHSNLRSLNVFLNGNKPLCAKYITDYEKLREKAREIYREKFKTLSTLIANIEKAKKLVHDSEEYKAVIKTQQEIIDYVTQHFHP